MRGPRQGAPVLEREAAGRAQDGGDGDDRREHRRREGGPGGGRTGRGPAPPGPRVAAPGRPRRQRDPVELPAEGVRPLEVEAIVRLEVAHFDGRTVGVPEVIAQGTLAAPAWSADGNGLVYLALPSTSPAYASLGYAEKLARWTALRDVLGVG